MIDKLLDETVVPFIRGGWLTGMVIGVTRPEGRRIFGYGRTDGEMSRAPGGDTVFNIGSVTKVFTGLLLADMVVTGKVSLSDPARIYLPSSIKLPRHRGRPDREITLLDLAAHGSGLPANPPDIRRFHLSSARKEYPMERIGAWLAGLNLESVPGEKFGYSNLGMYMLGWILARSLGMTYEDAVISRICIPLGLASTGIGLNREIGLRLVQGHDGELNRVPLGDYTAFGGAAALRSSVNDLVRLLECNLNRESSLREAMLMTHEIRLRADDKSARGLAWFVDSETGIIDHWGSVGGYRAYVGFLKSRGVGVAVLSNTSARVSEKVGMNLLRRLGGLPSEMPVPREIISIPGEVLRRYEGHYALGSGMLVTIKLREGCLWGHVSGEKPMRLWPETDRIFFSRMIERDVKFEKDGSGNVTGVNLGSGKDSRLAMRVGWPGRTRANMLWMIGRMVKHG